MIKNGSNDRGHSGEEAAFPPVSRRAILDQALDLTIPAVPVNVRTVLALTSEGSVDARKIADAILTDMGLTLKFFRLMNSAFFSPYRQDVISVRFMVVLLGFDNTSKIITSVPLMNIADNGLVARIMAMSLLSSEFARQLAVSDLLEPDTAVPCAMFASLGHIVLASLMPDVYSQIWNNAKFPWSRATFKKTTGWLPKDLASRIARAWNLPLLIRQCIQPPDDLARFKAEKQALIVTVSCLEQMMFCAALMRNSDDTQERLRNRMKKVLKISNKKMSAAMKEGLGRFEENSPVFYELLRKEGVLGNLLI